MGPIFRGKLWTKTKKVAYTYMCIYIYMYIHLYKFSHILHMSIAWGKASTELLNRKPEINTRRLRSIWQSSSSASWGTPDWEQKVGFSTCSLGQVTELLCVLCLAAIGDAGMFLLGWAKRCLLGIFARAWGKVARWKGFRCRCQV